MYADDTNLSVTGVAASDIEVRLNTELENVHEWLRDRSLFMEGGGGEFFLF